MKFIKISLLLLSTSLYAQAQTTDCEKALDDMQLMCEAAIDACQDIQDCLIRRDTCVDSVPKSEVECQTLNTCMQDNKGDFISDYTRCDYTWAIPSSGEGFCRVRKHFLFSEEACPGRTHGLLNAFAYGLNSSVDGKYNCESVVLKRKEKVDSCEDNIRQVRMKCGSVPANKRHLLQVGCEYATKFNTYRNREFALENASNRVNDTSRRNGSIPGPVGGSSGGSSGNSSTR